MIQRRKKIKIEKLVECIRNLQFSSSDWQSADDVVYESVGRMRLKQR